MEDEEYNEDIDYSDEWACLEEELCEQCGEIAPAQLCTIPYEENDEIEFDEKMLCQNCYNNLEDQT